MTIKSKRKLYKGGNGQLLNTIKCNNYNIRSGQFENLRSIFPEECFK